MLYNQFYDKNLFIPFNYIFPLVLHTHLHDVGRGMPSSPLDNKTGLDNIGHGMPSSPLDSKTQSNNIRRCMTSWKLGNIHGLTTLVVAMPSPPLECTQDRMTSSVECLHRPWKDTRSNDLWRGMLSLPFENTQDWTTCGMACPHGT